MSGLNLLPDVVQVSDEKEAVDDVSSVGAVDVVDAVKLVEAVDAMDTLSGTDVREVVAATDFPENLNTLVGRDHDSTSSSGGTGVRCATCRGGRRRHCSFRYA